MENLPSIRGVNAAIVTTTRNKQSTFIVCSNSIQRKCGDLVVFPGEQIEFFAELHFFRNLIPFPVWEFCKRDYDHRLEVRRSIGYVIIRYWNV